MLLEPDAKSGGGGEGHFLGDTQPNHADLAVTCATIRYWHRQRVFAMEQRKRADLALGSFLRTALGWSLALPKAEQDAIKDRAAALVAIGEKVAKQNAKAEDKRKPVDGADDGDYREWASVIQAAIASRAPFDEVERRAEKEMARLAESLPVWEWASQVRGFGAVSLAIIVAEAGNLSNYANPAKLWKRMGLALVGGVRQGGLTKTAPKDDWIEHGYNRERRSRMWNIGKALVYAGGDYADLYRARKQYEAEKAEAAGLTVAPSAKIPKKRAAEFMSLGHIDKRGQRYMEKRLLADLWAAWRDTN